MKLKRGGAMGIGVNGYPYRDSDGEHIEADHSMIDASQFTSFEELRSSLSAADEAMLDLGPTMAQLRESGASEAELREFYIVYGNALERRGKLQRLARSALEGEIEHLQPTREPEPTGGQGIDAKTCGDETNRFHRFGLGKIGGILGWRG